MLKATLLLCLLGPLLTGCATSGADQAKTLAAEPLVQVKTRFVDTACDWTKPIYVSQGDVLTDDTAKAILAHNLAGAKQCGWKPTGASGGRAQ